MKPYRVTSENKIEYCEYSESFDNIFRCRLTSFGYVWRCTKAERANCPDLEYCLKQKEAKH